MRFEHVYDELGRRIETHVDDSEWFVAPECEQPDNRAVNRVSWLAYQYRPDGLLTRATAYTRSAAFAEVADLPECTAEPPPGDEYVLADHLFDYDGFGNLTREVQSHGAPAAENSPAISYEWDFAGASAGNRNRLAAMTYPKPALEGGGREVSFVYGQPASLDDALDRVMKIEDDGWGELAKYSYMGLSRRVALMLAGVVTHSVAAGGAGAGYPGLDRFGRLSDLHYQLNAQDTIHRYQYGYDLAGNRTFARVTQAPTRALDGAGEPIEPPQWVPHINDRSWLYAYDGLNRLIDAGLGALDDFNAGLLTGGTGLPGGGTAPVPGTTEWSLDNLGNWAGGALGGSGPPVSVLLTGDFDGDGTADDDRTLHHDVNLRNQITAISEQGESGGPVVHDPAGNVVLHGEYYYQFDAFNRLVQVNLLGAAQVDAEDGRIVSGALGDLVAQYMYDGLGRLMAKRTPERLGSAKLQTKDFYYDGVRRVMEVITRHGVPPEPGRNDELKEPQREGEGESGEDGGEGGGEGGGEDPPGLPPLPVIEQWTDREYVYGPDYVDEFVAQFDRDGRPMLMLQDSNFNVVALVAGADDVFFDAGANALPLGAVLEQYVHDPYGSVRQADSFAEHAVNCVGHQGLFFDRFDGDWENAGLAPGAIGLYYNRNRFYSPPALRNVGDAENPDWRIVGLGRFISSDPNETALTLISALAMNGQPFGGPDAGGFDVGAHYGDGFNLYEYLGSNPVNSRDPMGLDVWDDFDDAIASQLSYRETATRLLGDAQVQIRRGIYLANLYAQAAFMWDDVVWDENEGILFDLVLAGFFARACFEAGTDVLLADGTTQPIECVEVGTRVTSYADTTRDYVPDVVVEPEIWCALRFEMYEPENDLISGTLLRPLTWLKLSGAEVGASLQLHLPDMGISGSARVTSIEACPESARGPVNGTVTGNFATQRAHTLSIHIVGAATPIGGTPAHLFYSLDRESWVTAGTLMAGERIRTADGVAIIARIDPTLVQQRVYNLEVFGTHTYFVSSVNAWVHNACTHGQLVKELRKQGFGPPRATTSGGGKMYLHANGTRIRIMPRPNRAPYPNEPLTKFQEAYYYRISGPNGGQWGPHTPVKGD